MIFNLCKKIYRFYAMLVALPFLLLTRFVSYIYVSELISLFPFRFGELVRYYFYKFSLVSCGEDVVIHFGAIISYPDVTIGNNVSIGTFNVFGHVDIGDHTLTAQGCHFLSGSQHHGFDDITIPIKYQAGKPGRIKLGPDIWIGANCTVMADIGHGCVIGAGSVVTKPIPDWAVAAGNPATIIRMRNK